MIDRLHLDYETKADVDLTKVGLDVYSSPKSRPDVLMAAYRINNGPLQHWERHKCRNPPAELVEALEDPEVEKWGFNSQFERVITNRVLGIDSPIKGWRCSQVLAYIMSFLGRLENVGSQIGLPTDKQKLKDGKRLIRKFTMPQKVTKNQPHVWRDWNTDPEDWQLFCEYNRQDVIAEEAIEERLGRYEIPEWRWSDYELDQLINDRGIPADPDFIENVIWMSYRRKSELNARIKKKTGVDNPNSVQQLLPWLQDNGYPFSDLQKETVAKALSLKIGDKELRQVLRLRQWASKTSMSKAVKAKAMIGDKNRIRYLFQFAGAGRTNRWAGRGVQPQNFARTPKMLDAEDDDGEKLGYITDLIRSGDYDGLSFVTGEPMIALSGCMRSLFRSPEGEKFVVADSKSIESAVGGWVTGCERMLKVFQDKRDPYRDFGTQFYGKAYDAITPVERNICKPPCLGCMFRLSGGKVLPDGRKTGLLKYAEGMGVAMTREEAERAVKVFREMYHEIPQFWRDCEDAVEYVLRTKKDRQLGFIKFHWKKPFLLIRLPSGRDIFYYKPMMQMRVVPTGRIKTAISKGPDYWLQYPDSFGIDKGDVYTYEETYKRLTFTYMGKNQKTTQWQRLDGHGGVITENVIQAIAYDVLMSKLRRLNEEDFNIVMHAHDEGGCLERIGANYHTKERMHEIFCEPIDWAPGLPLGASEWEGSFYRK